MRLDLYISKKYGISRNRAELAIAKGLVTAGGNIVYKTSEDVSDEDSPELLSDLQFSSQGGYKLFAAIKAFRIDVKGKVCADIGASNGGFTDCLLQEGAIKVYAVDVGECALPVIMQSDSRVVIKDRLNARYINFSDIGEYLDIITIDVSFISLKTILPPLVNILKNDGIIIPLIKPQFEIGRKGLSKSGIVRSSIERKAVIKEMDEFYPTIGMHGGEYIEYRPIEKNKNTEFLTILKKM